jgi:hypothetical protein
MPPEAAADPSKPCRSEALEGRSGRRQRGAAVGAPRKPSAGGDRCEAREGRSGLSASLCVVPSCNVRSRRRQDTWMAAAAYGLRPHGLLATRRTCRWQAMWASVTAAPVAYHPTTSRFLNTCLSTHKEAMFRDTRAAPGQRRLRAAVLILCWRPDWLTLPCWRSAHCGSPRPTHIAPASLARSRRPRRVRRWALPRSVSQNCCGYPPRGRSGCLAGSPSRPGARFLLPLTLRYLLVFVCGDH